MKMQLGNGRFEILRPIVRGEGGFALLYEAYDTALSINVAIKILKEEHRNNHDFVERFKNEAQVIAHLVHPNIVRIYDLNLAEYYYAMSLLPEPLLERLEVFHGILPLGQIIRMTIDITKALIELERAEIVHCDIKPSNILFDKQGNGVLTDFGIAIHSKQIPRAIIGTPEYMSPEQFRGDPLDTRSDLYSFGVLLYEITTGRAPFSGETFEIIEKQHLETIPVEPRKLVKVIDVQLENVILRLLQKNKEHRYLSAASLLDELNEVKERYRQKVLENVNIYKSNERFDLANAELKNYLGEVDPEDDVIKRELRLINFKFFIQDAQYNLSQGYFDQAKERIEQAKKIIISDTVLKEQFSLAQMNIIKAEQYHHDFVNNLKEKDFEKARGNLEKLLELAPQSEAIRKSLNLIDLLNQGVQNFERGRYSTALQNFESAKSLDEIGLEFVNDYIKRINEKLQIEEKHFNEHMKVIDSHEDLSRLQKYRDELLKIKSDAAWFNKENSDKMHDIYSDIHVELSEYSMSQGDTHEAQNHLNIALNYKPNEISLKRKLLEMTAVSYEKEENYNLAKEVYQTLTDEIDKSYFDKVTEMTVKTRLQKQFHAFEAQFHRNNLEDAKNILINVENELEQQKIAQPQYDYSGLFNRLKEYKLLINLKEVENTNADAAICEINKIYNLTQEHNRSNKDFITKETAIIKKNIFETKSDEIITAEFSEEPTSPDNPSGKSSPTGNKRNRPIFLYLIVPLLLVSIFFLIYFLSGHKSPEIRKSLLSITSIPENSKLFINDSLYQYSEGIFQDSIPVGDYVIKITNKNYLNYTKHVVVKENTPLKIPIAMEIIPDSTKTRTDKNGILQLTLNIDPDSIVVNGRNYTSSGRKFKKEFPPGSFYLSIKKQGYNSFNQMIELKPGEVKSKNVQLNPLPPGSLEINVKPYATVVIDEDTIARGKSKIFVPSISAGVHNLVLLHPVFWGAYSQKIFIQSDKKQIIKKKLANECGTLIVQIKMRDSGEMKPIWAHIFLNGKEIGTPKFYLKTFIFPGNYKLAVRREGYRTLTATKNINIRKEQIQKYEFELVK